MATTETTANQIKPGDFISTNFAGVTYSGRVRAVDPAVFTTTHTGVEHLLITFTGGGYFFGSDSSITIPADQTCLR